MKSYLEMIQYDRFDDRLQYLRLYGSVGIETFGFDRYLNQVFYKSKEWLDLRHHIIARDRGCDLGVEGFDIHSRILIHHINPIRETHLIDRNPSIFDPENLITTTHRTHNAIHFGTDLNVGVDYTPRKPGDTILW